jgi:HPt (histidine-containing phosphotransfer) domain-containing protein
MSNYHNERPEIPIDYAEVLERIGGDIAFLEELLKIYFVEFREKQNQVEAAIRGANFTLLQDLGHSLKGASANLSLGSLQRLAFALEVAGRERRIEDARSALASLVAECRRLEDYLRQNPPPAADL